jgi:hypothetical protein
MINFAPAVSTGRTWKIVGIKKAKFRNSAVLSILI